MPGGGWRDPLTATTSTIALAGAKGNSELDDVLLLTLLLVPFTGSVAAGLCRANARNTEAWLAAAVALTAFLTASTFYPRVTGGDVARLEVEWLPEFGLNFV